MEFMFRQTYIYLCHCHYRSNVVLWHSTQFLALIEHFFLSSHPPPNCDCPSIDCQGRKRSERALSIKIFVYKYKLTHGVTEVNLSLLHTYNELVGEVESEIIDEVFFLQSFTKSKHVAKQFHMWVVIYNYSAPVESLRDIYICVL